VKIPSPAHYKQPDAMNTLLILGTGCAKCQTLAERTEQAARELGLTYELRKITDLRQIMALGVMLTPALVVNGAVKVSGRVPSVEELKQILQQSADGQART
jgi:small redox-active disulfide protein 2